MRSITTLANFLAVTFALAFFGEASIAQTIDSPPGSAFQDQGIREENGDSVFVAGHGAYARANQRPRAYTSAEISTLPGHSARPAGMCWERSGYTGQDISSGYWTKCKSH